MENIWWERIPNAVRFINDAIDSLSNEKSVLFGVSEGLPWRDEFVDIIKDGVKQQNSTKSFKVISDSIINPGEFLLQEFCKKEKRAEFRASKGYPKFFAENDDIALHEQYIWLSVTDASELGSWMELISEYSRERGKNKSKATFILEWKRGDKVAEKKGIHVMNLADYVDSYDRVLFAMLMAASIHEKPIISSYLAELASNVIENDLELSAECMKKYKSFLTNPFITITEITQEEVRSDGSSYVFTKKQNDIEKAVWKSQIRTIYPILEEFREDFVDAHFNEIKRTLPIESGCGEIYEVPTDVELGTLMFLVGNGKIKVSTTEYDKLKKHKEARNKLSHPTALSLQEIVEIT